MNSEVTLQAKALYVSYGARDIIHDASFTLRRGEFTALIGLNGSGKTTLLRAVCGLLPIKSGACFVEGEDCAKMNAKAIARRISYLPQRHSVAFEISVLDVVLMGFHPWLRRFETPGKAHREKAMDMLRRLGIADFAKREFLELSEGEKQLVLLCRALVQGTPVMMLDEPDSALDFKNRHKMLASIREQLQKSNASGLITLHNPNYALEYCDHILLMKKGRIIDTLTPAAADIGRVREALQKVYGDIDIITYGTRFIMVKKEGASKAPIVDED